jgi:hypothetical protein
MLINIAPFFSNFILTVDVESLEKYDAALARTVATEIPSVSKTHIPPTVHFESTFNEDTQSRLGEQYSSYLRLKSYMKPFKFMNPNYPQIKLANSSDLSVKQLSCT